MSATLPAAHEQGRMVPQRTGRRPDPRPNGEPDHCAGRPTRVLVVAHDARVRSSLASLVAADDRLALAGTARTGEEARRVVALDPSAVEVVLVDVALPTRAAGHALIHDLTEDPACTDAVVSLDFDTPDDRSALAAGAVVHLTKSTNPEEIIAVLARIPRTTGTTAPARSNEGRQALGSAATPSLGRFGLPLAVLAMFVPPWLVWFSALAQSAGWWGWRLPQGAALWSMTLPLLAVVALRGGRPALADLWGRLTRWRVPSWTYAVGLALPILLGAASAAVAMALGSPSPIGRAMSLSGALAYLAYGTGLFLLTEECAWRGVLQPRLQDRLSSPVTAATAVGLVWGLWHVPLLLVPGQHDHGLPVAGFLLLIVPTSVLVSALVNSARGSVLVAAVFHASFDAAYSWFGVVGTDHRPLWAAVVLSWLAAAAVALVTRGRLVHEVTRRRTRL